MKSHHASAATSVQGQGSTFQVEEVGQPIGKHGFSVAGLIIERKVFGVAEQQFLIVPIVKRDVR